MYDSIFLDYAVSFLQTSPRLRKIKSAKITKTEKTDVLKCIMTTRSTTAFVELKVEIIFVGKTESICMTRKEEKQCARKQSF